MAEDGLDLEQEATRVALESARSLKRDIEMQLEGGMCPADERAKLYRDLVGICQQIRSLEQIQRDGF